MLARLFNDRRRQAAILPSKASSAGTTAAFATRCRSQSRPGRRLVWQWQVEFQ